MMEVNKGDHWAKRKATPEESKALRKLERKFYGLPEN